MHANIACHWGSGGMPVKGGAQLVSRVVTRAIEVLQPKAFCRLNELRSTASISRGSYRCTRDLPRSPVWQVCNRSLEKYHVEYQSCGEI
jgi:hypothetical protein